MAKKPRSLRPEEIELWQQVAKTADKLQKPRPNLAPETAPKPKPVKAPQTALPRFAIGGKAKPVPEVRHIAQSPVEHLRHAPRQMDAKSYKSMQRGKLKPEARIDLHGMTIAQAHPALNRFVLDAHRSGKRLILVITGKGGRRAQEDHFVPQTMGALKRQVPHWLAQAPLAPHILQVTEAHLRHGGSGAYYVYLRRSK